MTEESQTSGLGPNKLHDLLRICSEASTEEEQTDSDQRKAELLQDMLAETLPVEAFTGSLSKQMTTLCQAFGISSEESVGNLLSNPKTDVNLIRAIKDYFKKKSTKSQDEHDVVNLIYYSAIACALVNHNLKITKYSHHDLHKAFTIFTNVQWIPPVLSGLFGRACEYCQNKAKS
ncbi:MAG: hypothetical protein JSV61_09575 [Anaerolineales bacterium]|nr:MAG: hypothetical protein JSV61_09575 [Anaerolineales bacterium]